MRPRHYTLGEHLYAPWQCTSIRRFRPQQEAPDLGVGEQRVASAFHEQNGPQRGVRRRGRRGPATHCGGIEDTLDTASNAVVSSRRQTRRGRNHSALEVRCAAAQWNVAIAH